MEDVLKFLPLIVKNCWRSRRRTVLTIGSIAVSLCLLGVLGALYHMFFLSEATDDQALRLIVRNRVSLARPLPLFYREKIAQLPGVREVMVFNWFQGTYKDLSAENFFPRYAVDQDRLFTVYPNYKLPPDEQQAFLSERTACIVGRKLAQRLGFKIGDRITIVGDIYPVTLEFTVRGIYESATDNENLIFHYDYMREALRDTYMRDFADYPSTFVIIAENPEAVPGIARSVDEMFRNATFPTKTETEKQFMLSFLAFLGNVKLFLISICGAVTFTMLLVSANTMAMSVRERVREVGILKTLGFTQGAILSVLVSEAVLIALAGGVIGLALATGVCSLMRQMPSMVTDNSMIVMPPFVWAFGLALAVLIGLISSLAPAWGASRRSIVEALRYAD